MISINGKYASAVAYADELEEICIEQICIVCNQPFAQGSRIRIMPDAHTGKGCVIGTTMTIKDKIVPNLVGVDIGCGILTIKLEERFIDFQEMDEVVRKRIPSGFASRKTAHSFVNESRISELKCIKDMKTSPLEKAVFSVGTLGGGNHFIEVGRNVEEASLYLVIHSGSRNLGLLVAEHYQSVAEKHKPDRVPKSLAWLEGQNFENYLHDMKIMQEFAEINRQAIASEIIEGMRLSESDSFSTIHNYIDTEKMILRKGAVSAKSGEMLLIPLNMRDGSLICCGKGNVEWNYSAPHGAGRLYSRRQSKRSFTLAQFQKEMEGIYSTSIQKSTLDESPMAYKPLDKIIPWLRETVEIVATIKPVYNFKACGW